MSQHVRAFTFNFTIMVIIHSKWPPLCWPLTWSVSSHRQHCQWCPAAPVEWMCLGLCSFPSSEPASVRCRCRSTAQAAAGALRTAGKRHKKPHDCSVRKPITALSNIVTCKSIHCPWLFHIFSYFVFQTAPHFSVPAPATLGGSAAGPPPEKSWAVLRCLATLERNVSHSPRTQTSH